MHPNILKHHLLNQAWIDTVFPIYFVSFHKLYSELLIFKEKCDFFPSRRTYELIVYYIFIIQQLRLIRHYSRYTLFLFLYYLSKLIIALATIYRSWWIDNCSIWMNFYQMRKGNYILDLEYPLQCRWDRLQNIFYV